MPKTVEKPEVVIKNDYDGYFESLVNALIDQHEGKFQHRKILVTAGPYRPDAVTYRSNGDTILLDFYSALHAGFGSITDEEFKQLAELL